MNSEMIVIPGGDFHYQAYHRTREGGFILYDEGPRDLVMESFLMDRFEVTNADFQVFMQESNYQPAEPHKFLYHWRHGFPYDEAIHPVTWVSLEDARAYAQWAGKQLPTDIEWQWAAQGADGRPWPWGSDFDPALCNTVSQGTAAVDAYPGNTSPFGVQDLVGNVWEWIDVVCSDGWHHWCFLRGGSYYQPKGSNWYAEGGAQPVNYHHKFLLMYPGVDRCATIGFRCLKSISN